MKFDLISAVGRVGSIYTQGAPYYVHPPDPQRVVMPTSTRSYRAVTPTLTLSPRVVAIALTLPLLTPRSAGPEVT